MDIALSFLTHCEWLRTTVVKIITTQDNQQSCKQKGVILYSLLHDSLIMVRKRSGIEK